MTYVAFKRKQESRPIDHAMKNDGLMLQLARIVIVLMLSALGFLLSNYLGSIDKAINKISDTQERLTIMTARIDESVRHIEIRLDRMENSKTSNQR